MINSSHGEAFDIEGTNIRTKHSNTPKSFNRAPGAHVSNQQNTTARPGRKDGGNRGQRSTRAINLGRLAGALDEDMLAAALGLSALTLRSLIEGRDQNMEQQYIGHLAHRFAELGLQSSWLLGTGAPLKPEYLNALRKAAAASLNKEPIRRSNFKKLARAFEDRLEVLAEAVEMIPESILAIVEGRNLLDDERFNHINPRLMAAGAVDGWLELEEAPVSPELISNLAAIAADTYERQLVEDEADYSSRGQATIPENSTEALRELPLPEQTATASEPRATEVGVAPLDLPAIEISSIAPKNEQVESIKKTTQVEIDMKKTSGGQEAASSIPRGPVKQRGPAKLPRGALASGRTVSFGAASSQAYSPGLPTLPGNATASTAPIVAEPPVIEPQGAVASPQTAEQKSSGLPTYAQAMSGKKRGPVKDVKDTAKTKSMARVKALDPILDQARRGAKVTIWRDLVGSSQATWGNIRRGAVLFRDDLAARVEEAMGLPEGWLDNPSYPPATLAAWVTDADVPLPLAPADTTPTPPIAQAAKAVPAEAQPVHVEVVPTPVAPPEAATPAAPVLAEVPVLTAPAAASASATVKPVAQAAKADVLSDAFTWSPPISAQPVGQVGPLTQALCVILQTKALAGEFTETDALRLINQLAK